MGGSLEFICGCMYSGKTEELLRRARLEMIGRRKVQLFKSHRDLRFSKEKIQSHDGKSIDALIVSPSLYEPHRSSSKDLVERIAPDVDTIAIDEIQFFDDNIVEVCSQLANKGKKVITAGLTLDFRGEPFGHHILSLLAKADYITKLHAVCIVCGDDATMTQRLVDNKPAKWTDPIYMFGGHDVYQAVCRQHHVIERPLTEDIRKHYEVLQKPPAASGF